MVKTDEQPKWRNKIKTVWNRIYEKLNLNFRQKKLWEKKMNALFDCITFIGFSFLRQYIFYAKLNLLQFLLGLAPPLSSLFIDLSSKALL